MAKKKNFNRDEEKVCGLHAAKQAFVKRGQNLAKVYLEERRISHFGEILKFCAQNKIGYKTVAPEELKKITGSEHHEGICLCFKKSSNRMIEQEIARIERKDKVLILALHQAQNPHNIGAIMRVAAHFGVDLILLEGQQKHLSASTFRIAEGGAEHVPYVFVDSIIQSLQELKEKKYQIFSTSSHTEGSLYKTVFPAKTVIVMGKEDEGLPREIMNLGKPISIPGTGLVESLNLSTATSILLSEFRRQIPLASEKSV